MGHIRQEPSYLICDLDDCLIRGDLLWDSYLALLKKRPLYFFVSLAWLFQGLSYFKFKVSENIPFRAEILPFRQEIVEIIKSFRNHHGKVILASASPQIWVNAVSDHLNLFDRTIGSSKEINRKGVRKLEAIKEIIGESGFIYIGDSRADLPLWEKADKAILVNPSRSIERQVLRWQKKYEIIKDKPSVWKLLIKALRPHQWVKNFLLFLPALAAHHSLLDFLFWRKEFIAFIGFCFAASLVYVTNDITDLESDRAHHSKKRRPFASGNLALKWGVALIIFLTLGLILTIQSVSSKYILWVIGYLILNIAYSFRLKQIVVIDVVILSLMYTLRIFAGADAADVVISEWLLSFSTLFFFSLACAKRFTEIIRSKHKLTIDGRGYRQMDSATVQMSGISSGIASTLIILLYLQSNEVRHLYPHPERLWFILPVLLFWISRIWVLTGRNEMNDDPVVFAVKDKASWLCLLVLAVVVGVSM